MSSVRRTMTTYCAHIRIFILFGLVLSILAQNVHFPHFYQKTQRCNCDNNKECNTKDGSCPGDKCTLDYFGINCQHARVSFAMNKASTNAPSELLDGDDTTCVKQWNGPVVFELDKSIHFIWVYIFAETVITVNPSLTLYDNQNNPINQQFYQLKLTEKSLLIKSRDDVMYKKLKLSNLPKDVCSVEISIGRNLAISSTPSTGVFNSPAFVDGSDIHSGAIRLLKSKTTFRTSLLHNAKINHIMIVSNFLGHSSKWHFNIELTPTTGAKINVTSSYTDDLLKTHRQANIGMSTKPLIKEVAITLMNATVIGIDVMEVYIFGEFQCPQDKYGETCERHCPDGCGPKRCDPDWACAAGCYGNWRGRWCDQPVCRFRYGKHCQYPCPDGCGGLGDCAGASGTCLHGCKAGYLPPLCTTTCLPGTFDVNCSTTCTKCKKNQTTDEYSCDPTSGECLLGCADSYEGVDCERIIIRDDLISKTTGCMIAGLVLFLLLLFYKSLTRVEEESFEEELEVEEADVLQKADEEPPIIEEVTVPSDDPKHVETKPKEEDNQLEPKKEVKQLEPKKEVQHLEPKREAQHLEPKKEVQQLEPKEEVQQLESTPDEEVEGAMFHSLFDNANKEKASVSSESSESSAKIVIINPVLL